MPTKGLNGQKCCDIVNRVTSLWFFLAGEGDNPMQKKCIIMLSIAGEGSNLVQDFT